MEGEVPRVPAFAHDARLAAFTTKCHKRQFVRFRSLQSQGCGGRGWAGGRASNQTIRFSDRLAVSASGVISSPFIFFIFIFIFILFILLFYLFLSLFFIFFKFFKSDTTVVRNVHSMYSERMSYF